VDCVLAHRGTGVCVRAFLCGCVCVCGCLWLGVCMCLLLLSVLFARKAGAKYAACAQIRNCKIPLAAPVHDIADDVSGPRDGGG
jgi:hypothetical protein